MNGIQDCQKSVSAQSANPLIGTEKRCTRCGTVKGLEGFYARKDGKYGRTPHCKECFDKDTNTRIANDPIKVRVRKQKYHAANRESAKQRKRISHIKNHGLVLMRMSDYRRLHPERGYAVRTLNNAILQGKITRPDMCMNCNAIGMVDGHHDNYDKPLEVIWLCRSCHLILHRERS
jgi:hypothetical protein